MSYELALDVVDEIRQRWQAEGDRLRWMGDVSPKAMQQEGYGFDWWPGDFKVSLRAMGPQPEDSVSGDPMFRLSLKTEILDGLNIYLPSTPFWLSEINHGSPNRALTVPSPEIVAEADLPEREFPAQFNIVAYVTADNQDQVVNLFSGMGLLLPLEAHYMADQHAERTESEPARSTPPGGADPTTGKAPFEDIQNRYLAAGETTNAERVEQAFAAVMGDWADTAWTRGERQEDVISFEVSFGDQVAELLLRRGYYHEVLGFGLFAVLMLPVQGRVDEVSAQANLLNVMEADMWSDQRVPLFGAWTAFRAEGLAAVLCHESFVPALLDYEGLDSEMVGWMLRRAQWLKSMYLPETPNRPIAELLDE